MRYKPRLYHFRVKNYRSCPKTYILLVFTKKLLTSLLKSADVSKIMTSYQIFLCHFKHLRLLYNREKFQVPSIKNSIFRGGWPNCPPPSSWWMPKTPGLDRVKKWGGSLSLKITRLNQIAKNRGEWSPLACNFAHRQAWEMGDGCIINRHGFKKIICRHKPSLIFWLTFLVGFKTVVTQVGLGSIISSHFVFTFSFVPSIVE